MHRRASAWDCKQKSEVAEGAHGHESGRELVHDLAESVPRQEIGKGDRKKLLLEVSDATLSESGDQSRLTVRLSGVQRFRVPPRAETFEAVMDEAS